MASCRRGVRRTGGAGRLVDDGLGDQSRRSRKRNVYGWPNPSAGARCADVAAALTRNCLHSVAGTPLAAARVDTRHCGHRRRGGLVADRSRKPHHVPGSRHDHNFIRARRSRRGRGGSGQCCVRASRPPAARRSNGTRTARRPTLTGWVAAIAVASLNAGSVCVSDRHFGGGPAAPILFFDAFNR
jgi:hypothetical protein